MRLCKFSALILLCCILSGCASTGGGDLTDRLMFWKNEGKKSNVEIPKINVTGLDNKAALKTVIQTIITDTFEDIESEEDLDYAQDTLVENVKKAMRSKGYYNADIEYKYGNISITPNQATHIGSITINPEKHKGELENLDLKINTILDADDVLEAQTALYKNIQSQNCAVETDLRHRVFLNRKTQKAEIIFDVHESPDAKLGALSFSGNKTVKNEMLRKITKWEEGVCFDNDKIQAMRSKILGTGLFKTVSVYLPENAENMETVPVDMILEERKHRTVRAGLSFYTDEGVGAILGWQHRNYFGSGERLAAELKLSGLIQSLGVSLNKPYFLRENQNLSLNTAIESEQTDAFDRVGIVLGAAISRKISEKFSWSKGINATIDSIEEDGEDDKQTFGLVKPFVSLYYDSRDKPLDATKGLQAYISARPTFDVLGESDPFIKNEAGFRTYYKASDSVVLASRIKFGTILGNSTEDLPASERFFSGGGGSVRGFGFQDIGPFEDDNPLGGRSLIEFANEVRFKISDTFGAVAFIDSGKVDDLIIPSLDNIAIGAGAGVRYYTGFGPLRFDVGIPLQGDENTSQNYQIYISIGQAF